MNILTYVPSGCVQSLGNEWFVLSFSTGTVGPAFFALGVRDSILIILVVDLM